MAKPALAHYRDEEALMQALEGITEALKQVVAQQVRQDEKMEIVTELLHNIDKRLALVENSRVDHRLEDLDKRVDTLEHKDSTRAAVTKVYMWIITLGGPLMGGAVVQLLHTAH